VFVGALEVGQGALAPREQEQGGPEHVVVKFGNLVGEFEVGLFEYGGIHKSSMRTSIPYIGLLEMDNNDNGLKGCANIPPGLTDAASRLRRDPQWLTLF